MREVTADLWSFIGVAEHICITTNPIVNSKALAVMGRGCALEAATRWPYVREMLAQHIGLHGNTPHALGVVGGENGVVWRYPSTPLENTLQTQFFDGGSVLWSFPVKHHWQQPADLVLIMQSAKRLKAIIDMYHPEAKLVVIPRPGCGNGRLEWPQVAEKLAPILDDDRFLIVTK